LGKLNYKILQKLIFDFCSDYFGVVLVLVAELELAAVFASIFTALVFVSTTAFAFVFTSTFAFASGATIGTSSVGASGFVVKTDIFPVKAGIARSNADSINVVAAAIVIFDKIVCEPRG
jgi:hypothetical protein